MGTQRPLKPTEMDIQETADISKILYFEAVAILVCWIKKVFISRIQFSVLETLLIWNFTENSTICKKKKKIVVLVLDFGNYFTLESNFTPFETHRFKISHKSGEISTRWMISSSQYRHKLWYLRMDIATFFEKTVNSERKTNKSAKRIFFFFFGSGHFYLKSVQ